METLENKNTFDETTRNKIKFITFIITQFARAYKMNNLIMLLVFYDSIKYLPQNNKPLPTVAYVERYNVGE